MWREYERMLDYNASIQLDDNVRVNENFFVGRQWEGVESNGLPTPVFNFLKRVTLFTVASCTSDNVKLAASPLGGGRAARRAAEAVNAQFEEIFERNGITVMLREFLRNAAVDGDAATYTYWDAEADAGGGRRGAVVTEIVRNTRVGFGNTAERRVEEQPYILIKRRELTPELRERARKLGCAQWEEIESDADEEYQDGYKDTGGRTTVLLRLWKNDETGTVWACECARGAMIRGPWDLGLRRYPVTWMCWDNVQDSYHGQAMLTGLIPNQIYINKLFAMTMTSLMMTAYPKIIYDRTRIAHWDNGIGRAIGVSGGDMSGVARILEPAQISPQIAQFISLTQELTQSNLGATSVALGDARPDNTSAIIALQRAAATPNELTRQALYQSVEDLGRIYIDFMAGYYGVRTVELEPDPALPREVLDFAAGELALTEGGKIEAGFDFGVLRELPMRLKLDVGASAYWSEVASVQTLDNLLAGGHIDILDYLERVPDSCVTDRRGLVEAIRSRRAAEADGQG